MKKRKTRKAKAGPPPVESLALKISTRRLDVLQRRVEIFDRAYPEQGRLDFARVKRAIWHAEQYLLALRIPRQWWHGSVIVLHPPVQAFPTPKPLWGTALELERRYRTWVARRVYRVERMRRNSVDNDPTELRLSADAVENIPIRVKLPVFTEVKPLKRKEMI